MINNIRISPVMQARINVLNSQIATRAHIAPEQLNTKNKMLVHQINLQKADQRFSNREQAKGALTDFLQPGRTNSPAHALEKELNLLGAYIVSLGPPGLRWIPGPLKKIDKAMGKTIEDYDYAWGKNKDLIRGTLACRSNEDLDQVSKMVFETCTPNLGMGLIKQDHQQSIRDDKGGMPSGYSGWNFVVQFKEHKLFGAEVQANTFDLLYGKHSKEEVIKYLQVTPDEYAGFQTRLKFPGGLGHALYDIQDTARSKASKAEGDWAREMACNYNDACRGNFRMRSLEELNKDIKEMASRLTSDVAKKLWKHAVEGSAWAFPIPC
ncbi:MAG TPA: hypothetical protein VGM67_00220 [Gemmatimonadaceae bacterium]